MYNDNQKSEVTVMYCNYCGEKNEDGIKFCIKCGKQLPVRTAQTGKTAMDRKVFEEYAQLSKRIKAGDELAFSEMYEKSSRLVYATCYGVLGNHEDASDAMQNTYLTVYKNIASLRDDMMFISWIKQIAATRSLNIYRSKHADLSYDDTIGTEEDVIGDDNLETLPDSLIMEETKRSILDKILREELSDVQYQTVLFYYYDEFPVENIAKLMGCPEGTVKTRLKAARVRIRQGIEKYEKKTGDKLHAAMPLPFLMRFFLESAKKLPVPKIDIASITAGASSAASASSAAAAKSASAAAKSAAEGVENAWEAMGSASASGAGVSSASAVTAAASGAVGAVKTGFLATAAGKAIAVTVAAAVLALGGFGIKHLVDSHDDDDDNGRRPRREREDDRDEDETELTEISAETEAPTETEPLETEPVETEPVETEPEISEPITVSISDIPDYDQLEMFVTHWTYPNIHEIVGEDTFYSGTGLYMLEGGPSPTPLIYTFYFDDITLANNQYRLSVDELVWIERNILNLTDEEIGLMNSGMENKADSEGYISFYNYSGTGDYTSIKMSDEVLFDGTCYYVQTTLSSYEESPFSIYFTMQYKNIDGRDFWTMVDCSNTGFEFNAAPAETVVGD